MCVCVKSETNKSMSHWRECFVFFGILLDMSHIEEEFEKIEDEHEWNLTFRVGVFVSSFSL